MATCNTCGREMRLAPGCVEQPNTYRWHEAPGDTSDLPERCHDCNAAPGEYHHPGCVLMVCTVCHEQVLGQPHAHAGEGEGRN